MINKISGLTRTALAAFTVVMLSSALAQTGTAASTTPLDPVAVSTKSAAGRLANTYGAQIGSAGDARSLVNGLRTGTDVTVGEVTFAGTGKTMGYGNINIAMSLAKSQLGTEATPQDFLSALSGVMDLRSSGMGWGQIAKDLGVNLGQVVSASKNDKVSSQSSGKERGSVVADGSKSSGQGQGAKGRGAGDSANANGNGNGGNSGNSGNSGNGNSGNGGNSGSGSGGGGGGGKGK